jgi:uncharacterized protein (TIGR00251 family)
VKARPRSRRSRLEAPGVTISVRIQPRASKNGITRMEDGSFKIRLTAPPVDGAANEALVEFLAEALQVSRSAVEIISGHTARDKRISLAGMSRDEINRLLNADGKKGII